MQLTLTPTDILAHCYITIKQYRKNIEVITTKHSLIIYGQYPIRIKALIDKLMIEKKLTPGKVVHFNNAVMYTPTGKTKFYDEDYSI